MRQTADEATMQLVETRHRIASGVLQQQNPGVFVEFGLHPRRNPLKSADEGREVFDDVEYVRIVVPGDRDGIHRPATQRDREMYPQQYAAFRANQNQDAASGTPLSHVPWLSPAQVAELRYYNCRTVDQLAAMPDSAAQKFPGIATLKQKAKDFIEVARNNAPVAQLREELTEERRKNAALEARLTELAEEVKALQRNRPK